MLIAIFVHGRFRQLAEADSEADAEAFCQGFVAAAEILHADAGLYIMSKDEAEMREHEHRDEVRRALEAMRETA